MKKKVCIVSTSLDHGGAERAASIQSIMFDEIGFEVYIVTVNSGVAYKYKGYLFNLGDLKNDKDSSIGRVFRLYHFKKFLDKHKFNFIIDNRPRNQWYREFFVSKFIYNCPTIYVIHSFEESTSFTKFKWLNKFLYKNEFMVTVSKALETKYKKLYDLNKIATIYNAFDFDDILIQSKQKVTDFILEKYIIYFGRIDDKAKNLKLLLDAYSMSELNVKGIKLLILGDGPDVNMIKAYSQKLKLGQSVIFKGFTPNPFPYVKNALFSILTSRSEGFAMVIPESLSLGVPVVSVDCNVGPKEILINEYNGLLVENFNKLALSQAINRFVEDSDIYIKCKKNSVQSIKEFSIKKIIKHWENLFFEQKLQRAKTNYKGYH